jgi:hypothetical protein
VTARTRSGSRPAARRGPPAGMQPFRLLRTRRRLGRTVQRSSTGRSRGIPAARTRTLMTLAAAGVRRTGACQAVSRPTSATGPTRTVSRNVVGRLHERLGVGRMGRGHGRYWTGPHIYTSEVDFRSNPVDVNGVPVSWTTHLRKFATCHEMAGHGYGGNHTGSGAGGNPSYSASCLTGVNYNGITPETLGAQVRSDMGGGRTTTTSPRADMRTPATSRVCCGRSRRSRGLVWGR